MSNLFSISITTSIQSRSSNPWSPRVLLLSKFTPILSNEIWLSNSSVILFNVGEKPPRFREYWRNKKLEDLGL